MFITYTYHFYKNKIVLAEPQYFYFFPNFRLICYFVLVTIAIFDLALHICIFIIHAEYFWLVTAGLKGTFYTLILKFAYITFCLLREPQTMLQLRILMAYTFIKKFLLSLCILFIHCSFVSSFN